jgi:hypothetical protein
MIKITVEFLSEKTVTNYSEINTIDAKARKIEMIFDMSEQSLTGEFVLAFKSILYALGHQGLDRYFSEFGEAQIEDFHQDKEKEEEFFKKNDEVEDGNK